jgi:hypothetical protein
VRWGPFLFDDPLQIIDSNEDTVVFRGFSSFLSLNIGGSMDRVTGDVVRLATTEKEANDYLLNCKPTQWMF